MRKQGGEAMRNKEDGGEYRSALVGIAFLERIR